MHVRSKIHTKLTHTRDILTKEYHKKKIMIINKDRMWVRERERERERDPVMGEREESIIARYRHQKSFIPYESTLIQINMQSTKKIKRNNNN